MLYPSKKPRIICPLDCPKRNIYCHSTCERYLKFRKERAEISKAEQREVLLNGHVISAMDNFKKGK